MSLTSYRAAPSRGKSGVVKEDVREDPGSSSAKRVSPEKTSQSTYPLGRPGGDLLSHALRHSTIGSGGLNDRVRDGIGWGLLGKTTRSTKQIKNEKTSTSDANKRS